jgi:acyl carrier protein
VKEDAARGVILAALGGIAPEADPAAIDPKVDLREQLDIDSMDFLNFVVAVHDATGIEIPEADYPRLLSLDGAVAYLVARTGAV